MVGMTDVFFCMPGMLETVIISNIVFRSTRWHSLFVCVDA